jgi:hypothetical protein
MAGWFGWGNHHDDAEMYGRHTVYQPDAVPVVGLLQKAVSEGRALRLKWREDDGRQGWPTGVMAAV